jgi:hypothetical protein
MKTSKSMELASLDLNEHMMKNSSKKLALLIHEFHTKKHNETIALDTYIQQA